MRRIAVHFPIVVYPSEDQGIGRFTAHCLNLDLLSDGDSVEGAISSLLELIEQQLDAAEEYGADPFQRAPAEYWKMIGEAVPVPPELVERIVSEANQRNRHPGGRQTSLDPSQIDARELLHS